MSGADLPPVLGPSGAPPTSESIENSSAIARLAAALTRWTERWVPDPFVFALAATVVVAVVARVATPMTAGGIVDAWGAGLWDLLPFTMQMSLVIVTGYVLASAPPIHRLLMRIARVPSTDRGAIVMVAGVALGASWLNWGFGLVVGAMLAREVARVRPDVDYRTLAATSFLGLGSIWAQGLSGSAALQMATASALPEDVRAIVAHGGVIPGGVVPLRSTIFLWQSQLAVLVEVAIVLAIVAVAAPTGARARSAASLGIDLAPAVAHARDDVPTRPGERPEHSPWLTLSFVGMGALYLARLVARVHFVDAITLNTLNLAFLVAGAALHRTPARLMRAFREATPAVWSVVLQFPLYAGLAAIIVKSHLNDRVAAWLVGVSTQRTFPAVIAIYSMILGVFVPSGGSKWIIEAPYVMQSAHALKVHVGWMVAVYDLGEALANLIQPFWMLPLLGLFKLRARDVMGLTLLVFLVLTPVVLALVTALGATLRYPL